MAARDDDAETQFLETFVPRLGLCWPGFKRVQGTLRRRLRRRLAELALPDVAAYAAHLDRAPKEWETFDALCRISISRFGRDHSVFEYLEGTLLREGAEQARRSNRRRIRVWSAGCASGEEPYSVVIAWRAELQREHPSVALDVLGTDLDPQLLKRARRACYPVGSLRELPERWRRLAFDAHGAEPCLRPELRRQVRFERADLRREVAAGPFDIVLCRNLAFTYFDAATRARVARAVLSELRSGGALVIGAKEVLPPGLGELRERYAGVHEKLDAG